MKVLIAVDGGPASEAAAARAVALFGGGDAEFYVLCVAEDPPPWVIDPLGITMPEAAGRGVHVFGVRDGGEATVTAAGVAATVPEAEVLVAEGDAVREICTAAEELDADVIVLGGVERGFLHRLVDPPVADDVLHATRRPVLVVHGPPGSGGG